MQRKIRIFLLMALDVLLVNAATVAAILLISKASLLSEQDKTGAFAIATAAVSLFSFYMFGLYNRIWEFAGARELYVIIKAVTLTGFLQFSLNHFLFDAYLPGSLFLLSWILILFFVGGSRFCWRVMRDLDRFRLIQHRKKPVLIVGAGGAGAMVARSIQDNETDLAPVGFADDSDFKQNMKLHGLPVLGKRENIPAIVENRSEEHTSELQSSLKTMVLKKLSSPSLQRPARISGNWSTSAAIRRPG